MAVIATVLPAHQATPSADGERHQVEGDVTIRSGLAVSATSNA
jgi:hypothetical protein